MKDEVKNCIDKCVSVLGLKRQEIAKLMNVSRATLDLNEKGKGINDEASYKKLYDFMVLIEGKYGDEIKKGVRTILIEKKTLIQHLFNNVDNLDNTISYFDKVASKVENISIEKTDMNDEKINIRLSGIGKMA